MKVEIGKWKFVALLVALAVGLLGQLAMAEDLTKGMSLAEKLTAAPRSEEDKARDEGRNPAGVLAFLGVEPGMTVMDVMASGGWYTEVLSVAVGPKGKVYAHNLPAFLKFRDGFYDQAISARLAGNRLANVVRVDKPLEETGIKPRSIDVAITALNFHDIYNRDPEAAINMLKTIKKLLKPNGILGIIDHRGAPDSDLSQLHRMMEADVVSAAKKAGYFIESSKLLSNSSDDYQKMVFAPEVRGKTDRFLLKLINFSE